MDKWTKAGNWIQPADHSWWKVAVIKWAQIDFFIDIGFKITNL